MIYQGNLNEKITFEVHRLSTQHVQVIEALQVKVCDALEDATILQPLSTEELLTILGGNGLMIGAFVGPRLIAFRALFEPDPMEDEHLGIDAGAVDLSRVLYQEISNVDPDFRGHGLQKILGELVMKEVDTLRFDLVCATVKPFNIASLKDKFGQGMQVVALKLKYGGKLRYVFAKSLHTEAVYQEDSIILAMADVETQQSVIKQGFVGVSMHLEADVWQVVYKKLK